MKRTGMGVAILAMLWGNAQADDLAATYDAALASDAQYRAARAQYVSVEERVPQSLAGLRPSVGLSANTSYNHASANTFQDQDYNSNGYTVTLTQPLLRMQNYISVEQSRVLVDQAKAQLDLARQDLLLRTAQAYFDVLLAQDTLRTVQALRAANKQQLDQAQRSFDIGTTSITDVRDAKARYDLSTAQEINARNDLSSKAQALRLITNKEPAELAPLRQGVVLSPPVPSDMEAWVQSAETSGIAVLAAQSARDATRLESKKATAAHLPTLDLVASDGYARSGTTTSIGTEIYNRSIGVQFNLPIYSGGGTVGREREVAALLEKADADLDGARRSGALAARQAYLGATSGLAQVQALEEAVVSARTALDANKKGVEVGVRINVDVLNAQQQLAATERDLAKSRYDTLMFLLRLKGASGSLGEQDVKEINGLLAAGSR